MNEITIDTKLTLNDGRTIPQLGFGVFQITEPGACTRAVLEAFAQGYRHIDTAQIYDNEGEVGTALRETSIARDEIFVTTKCWMRAFGKEKTRVACEESLRKLKTDYVDLLLLHWPNDKTMMEAWDVLLQMQEEGKVRSVGVSNFTRARFEDFFFKHTDVLPVVNQIELHPFCTQHDIAEYCLSHDIRIESYSPLVRAERLDDPTLNAIGAAHGKSAAQVMLRWQLQKGHIVLPKSANPSRIAENADIYNFSLSTDEMTRIDGLDEAYFAVSWRPNGWY